jgi:hypothetical protein
MGALSVKTKHSTSRFSWDEAEKRMRVIARKVLREEIQSVHVDSRGYLIFPNEAEYAAYLKTQPDKLPSEIKAYFINPEGFQICYSDYELTPKKARELRERKNEPTVPAEKVWEELRKLGVE